MQFNRATVIYARNSREISPSYTCRQASTFRVRSHRHDRLRIRVPVYWFQETRVCMHFYGGRSHWYEFCTSTGYLWISLVRAVSVQVVFYPTRMKWTTQNLHQFNLYRPRRIFDVISYRYVTVKLFIIRGAVCTIGKIIKRCIRILLLFSQSIHSIRFHWRLPIDTRWVMCLYKWPRTLHSCQWSLYEWQTTRKRKPGLGLVLALVSMWT